MGPIVEGVTSAIRNDDRWSFYVPQPWRERMSQHTKEAYMLSGAVQDRLNGAPRFLTQISAPVDGWESFYSDGASQRRAKDQEV